MKNYVDFINSQIESRVKSSPNAQIELLHRPFKHSPVGSSSWIHSANRTPSKSPLRSTSPCHSSKKTVANLKEKNQSETSYATQQRYKKVTQQNAKLAQQRKSLFLKNCQLINQINKIKKETKIDKCQDDFRNANNFKSRETGQRQIFQDQQIQKLRIKNSQLKQKILRINDELFVSNEKNDERNEFQYYEDIEFYKHQSPISKNSRRQIDTQKRIRDFQARTTPGINNSNASHEIFQAQKTTPIPESTTELINIIKNKSLKCFHTKKNIQTDFSSCSKVSKQQDGCLMLVKMCKHCSQDLRYATKSQLSSHTPKSQLFNNTPKSQLSNYSPKQTFMETRTSHDTIAKSASINKMSYQKRQQEINKNKYTQIKTGHKKPHAIEQLQAKIRRIRKQNNELRRQILNE